MISSMKVRFLLIASLSMAFCLQLSAYAEPEYFDAVPFRYAAGHIITMPVQVCGEYCTFILDTGCGVNILSEKLIKKFSCKPIGKHSGKRMSGQELCMEMFRLPTLQVGTCVQKDVPVASWKVEQLIGDSPELKDVQGFVSLDFFKNNAFTLDYQKSVLYVENSESLKQRSADGITVPIGVNEKRGVETSISMPLSFSDGSKAKVEVDTGSGQLILDTKYMKIFGIDPRDKNVKTVSGTDETKHAYVRYFTQLPVDIMASDSARLSQKQPDVEFQKIIYDGLVGDKYLSQFTVTYDLPSKRMILAPH